MNDLVEYQRQRIEALESRVSELELEVKRLTNLINRGNEN